MFGRLLRVTGTVLVIAAAFVTPVLATSNLAAAATVTSGVTVAGGAGAGSAANQLNGAAGVFVDSAGSVYVADPGNDRVQEWAPGATSGVTVAGGNGAGSASTQLDIPSGVSVDGVGDVYVADAGNNRVQEWAPGATAGVTVAGGNGVGSGANQLDGPEGLFVDGSGNVYVSDSLNNRVQEWAPGATSGVTVAGGNGSGSGANQLNLNLSGLNPFAGVFVSGSGNVYVSDFFNNRVQEWAPGATSGVTVAGGNGLGSAANQFEGPSGVWVDGAGNVYVGDALNNRVQEWAPGATSGVTVAGGNGQGSAANQLAEPLGLFVDSSSNIYVADSNNNRVQDWGTVPNAVPFVTINPQSTVVSAGKSVSFTAAANGAPAPTVQWQQSTDGGSTWSDIAGATSTTYSISSAIVSQDGFEFRAVFTNVAGSATTNPATLIVVAPPTTSVGIPSNGATITGGTWLDAAASSPVGLASVNFEVSGGSLSDQIVSGATPTLYGWIGGWNTTSVPNGTYTIQSVATDVAGVSTTSAPITVTVNNPPPSTTVIIPSNGANQSGTTALLDATTAGNVTGVSYELTGGTLTNQVIATGNPTLYGWLTEWNTTSVPNGTYTLQSVGTVGTVGGGGTVTSAPITITVSN